MKTIDWYLNNLKELSFDKISESRTRVDSLVKPPGSLGKLEDIAIRLAGITGNVYPSFEKRALIIMASDNGVVSEGVSSAPQSVTYAQTRNFLKGITGAAVLAKHFNADLKIVDIGVNGDFSDERIINRKIRKSTNNIAVSHAMTRDEAERAVLTGIELAIDTVEAGYSLLGTGEMGIGNTTTSSAVLCALTGIKPEKAVGKGAGLDNESYKRKIEIVADALKKYEPDSNDPLDVLSKVGGFDIGGIAGLFIGAAYMGVPIVVDGFISIVSALLAMKFNERVKDFMFLSHASYEQGYAEAARVFGDEPPLLLNMRLGEGSGCPIMFSLIDASCDIVKNMGTFDDGGIDDSYLEEAQTEGFFDI